MTFFDEINIYIASGKGGDGLFSFSKERNSKYKKADGGNGGKGGNVYILGDTNYLTFYKLKFKKTYKASDGLHGKKNNKTGKNGQDLIIKVPIGTTIYDNERKLYIGEIKKHKEKILIAKGGREGYGNSALKSVTKLKENLKTGGISEIKFIHLELFLISDIGLLGYPNVGKSSITNKISRAKNKIADYDFTTINPNLSILKIESKKKITITDIPGLIKYASKGKGLGFNFLKHLSKNKLIFNIIDVSKMNKNTIIRQIITLKLEIENFDKNIYNKEKWLILNKIDLIDKINNNILIRNIKKKFNFKNIFYISAKKNIGIKKFCFNINERFLKEI